MITRLRFHEKDKKYLTYTRECFLSSLLNVISLRAILQLLNGIIREFKNKKKTITCGLLIPFYINTI